MSETDRLDEDPSVDGERRRSIPLPFERGDAVTVEVSSGETVDIVWIARNLQQIEWLASYEMPEE